MILSKHSFSNSRLLQKNKSKAFTLVRQMRKAVLLVSLLASTYNLIAQISESQIASDSLIRAGYSSLGRAGFDTTSFNGFYIQDQKKAKFRLNFGVWTTPRYNYITLKNTPDSIQNIVKGYTINRTRIYLTGSYTEKLSFAIVTNIGGDGKYNLQQVYLSWAINDRYILNLGNQFVASSREDWMDPANILSMQCSANDAVFALGTSFGALLYSRPRNHMRWWVSLSNGLYGWNRERTQANQSDYMIGGRYEYALRGNDWTIWDDLVGRRGRSTDILFGTAVNYVQQTYGKIKDYALQVNLDATFNGNGYQVLVAGVWTRQYLENILGFNQYGLYMQGGYFFTNTFQAYARYDLVSPGNMGGNLEVYSAPGIGINIYPFHFTNKWKFTVEYNHLYSTMNKTIVAGDLPLGFVNSDYYGQRSFRFQLQFGF